MASPTRAWGILALIMMLLPRQATPQMTQQEHKPLKLEADEDGQLSPLFAAAWGGDVTAAEKALDAGEAVNARDADAAWTALTFAAFQGHTAVAELLLARGADVDSKTTDDATPLMLAGYNGHAYTAKVLLDNGADCAATDSHGDTALAVAEIGEAERRERHLGAEPPKSEVVELLRGCKAYKSRKSLNPPGALPPAGPDGENVIGVDSDAAPTNKDEL